MADSFVLKHFDFLIVCTQRSGSHLLASALNSHPDISCRGELREKDRLIKPSQEGLRGAILMYNRCPAFGTTYTADKLIHLVRDPKNTAKSRLANSIDKKEKGNEHSAHFLEIVDREFELNGKRLKGVSAAIRNDIRRAKKWLKGHPHLEISYEELTGNCSVSTIRPEISARLTDFLGLPKATLSTDLVKPNTTYSLKG